MQPEARQLLPGCRENQEGKDDDELSTSYGLLLELKEFISPV